MKIFELNFQVAECLKEIVVQKIIPHMEKRVRDINHQVRGEICCLVSLINCFCYFCLTFPYIFHFEGK